MSGQERDVFSNSVIVLENFYFNYNIHGLAVQLYRYYIHTGYVEHPVNNREIINRVSDRLQSYGGHLSHGIWTGKNYSRISFN